MLYAGSGAVHGPFVRTGQTLTPPTGMERKMMKITVEIADKPYRLTISADEEQKVRRAAEQIKRQIAKLKREFDATLIEYLSMAAMRISIENEENKERLERGPEAFKLKALVSQLDDWVGRTEDPSGGDGVVRAAERPPIVKPKAKRGRPRKNRPEGERQGDGRRQG